MTVAAEHMGALLPENNPPFIPLDSPSTKLNTPVNLAGSSTVFSEQVEQIRTVAGRTGTEILEQLSSDEFDIVKQALCYATAKRLRRNAVIDPEDVAQNTMIGFMRTYNIERYDREKDVLVFPNPSLLTLFGINRNMAVNAFRTLNSQPQQHDTHLEELTHLSEDLPGRDFTDRVTERMAGQTTLKQLLEGRNLNPLRRSILGQIYAGEKIDAEKLATLHNTDPGNVRITKFRLLRQLRSVDSKPQAKQDDSVLSDLSLRERAELYGWVKSRALRRGLSDRDVKDVWAEVKQEVTNTTGKQFSATSADLIAYAGVIAGRTISRYVR